MTLHSASMEVISWNWLRLGIKRLLEIVKTQRYLLGYSAAAMIFVLLTVAGQYQKFDMFGTKLLLGWDSPYYVWMANEVIGKGVFPMLQHWDFPQLYTLLLTSVGYLSGNIVDVERIFPMLLGLTLILMDYELTLSVTNNVHIAGLSALLTGMSLNFLRLFSDLHRNLMAYALGMLLLFVAPELDRKKLLERRFALFVLVFIVIASTHIETFLMLSFCLILYALFSRNKIVGAKVLSACLVSATVLIVITPAVLEYPAAGMLVGVAQSEQRLLSPQEIMLWSGGSWLSIIFFILGIVYLSEQSILRKNERALPLLCWLLAIASVLISASIMGLSVVFAQRAMLVLPVSVIGALSVQLANDFLKRANLQLGIIKGSSKIFSANLRKPILTGIAVLLISNSLVVSISQGDSFLTPYISRSVYEEILVSGEYLKARSFSLPVLIFYGQASLWTADVVRSYWGAEFGEHFAYYGPIESLLRLESTQSFSLPEERLLASRYFNELVGNESYVEHIAHSHSLYVKDKALLASRPLVILTPQLYEHNVPYYLKQFHIGRGIYIVPPNSVTENLGIVYGSTVTVLRNGISSEIRMEYLYVDPFDPSVFYVRVNGSRGFESYNFTDIPRGFRFVKLEQGGSLSSPEYDPKRLDGSAAINGNDPADTQIYWSPWQYGNIAVSSSVKKEGSGSLQVTGKTNEWGTLFSTYDPPETWDLGFYTILSVWAKSNATATLAINLHDLDGRKRTYWDLRADGESLAADWKRFTLDLTDYSYQDDGFNINAVDYIALYVSSQPWMNVSFYLDDLTVDRYSNTRGIYKTRVLADEAVIAFFSVREES